MIRADDSAGSEARTPGGRARRLLARHPRTVAWLAWILLSLLTGWVAFAIPGGEMDPAAALPLFVLDSRRETGLLVAAPQLSERRE